MTPITIKVTKYYNVISSIIKKKIDFYFSVIQILSNLIIDREVKQIHQFVTRSIANCESQLEF
jgi:hypothetical protein